jgi:ABC-type dipeptide/oligopeptide/nickel transport system ATPase component
MSDIINFYEHLPKHLKAEVKLDKNFKKHYILPNSMICIIGSTGCGKSNAILNWLSRCDDKFYQIIVFNPNSTDEPLYNFLKEKIPELQTFSDIEELPDLKSFEDDKKHEKLLIVDDFINLNPKSLKKILDYLIMGRKSGFSVICQSQNYTSIPKVMLRNIHYFLLFRLNDNISINNIIRNHNIDNIDKNLFKKMYIDATTEKLNFFTLDLKGGKETRYRKNLTDFYKVT